MIDFHSHILPGIDDGAENSKMSIEMITKSVDSGVTTIVATPHCYLQSEESIQHFLSHREASYRRLLSVMREQKIKAPKIVLGSEVHLAPGMSKLCDLEKLCLSGTNYILIEMPYEPWADWMFEEVYEVTLQGFRPIMAHLDRFLSQEKYFPNLYSIDVLFQINAGAFLERKTRRKVLEFFQNDSAHVIGSDMHNLTTRPPNLAEAYEIINKKFGWEYVDYLKNNSDRIVSNNITLPTGLPRLGFKKKLFL